MKNIKFDGDEILKDYFQPSPVAVVASQWQAGKDRTLEVGAADKKLEIEFTGNFPRKKGQPAGDFALQVSFK